MSTDEFTKEVKAQMMLPKFATMKQRSPITEFAHLLAEGKPTRAHITRFVKWMMTQQDNLGHDPFPLYEHLADGFYRREVHLPKGHVIVGAVHTQESYAIVMRGKVTVIDENGARDIEGPCTLTQKAGMQKIGYVHEDCIWLDIHRTEAETTEQACAELFLDTYDDYDRLDYWNLVDEMGLTEEQVRAITEREDDLIALPQEIMKVVEVRPSHIEGNGLFARIPFRSGDVVAPARVGTNRTPAGRYTNHSPSPNVVAKVHDDVIDFVATRNIDVGDEITVDYRQALDVAQQLDRRQSCQQ